METSEPGSRLTRAADGLARAERMLEDLARHEHSTLGFGDRLPYVLDLLAGVTRTIDEESKGKRTPAFSSWWSTVNVTFRSDITALRHAELKRLEPGTSATTDIVTNVSAADFPNLPVNDGDTVQTVTWVFTGDPLAGRPVLPLLRNYLASLGPLLDEAEARLSRDACDEATEAS